MGDDTRGWGPPYVTGSDGSRTQESAYFLAANRNKRSIAVDISTPEGVDIVRKLVQQCDVMIENFKVGGLKKYGLDYESLVLLKPNLVYCSISGYGQTGPNSGLPGYDLMAQGYGGIMSLTGEVDGEPMKVGVGIADVMCGMYAATAILAALRHRDQTQEGQYIDIGLVDTQIAWLINEGTNYLTSGKAPARRANQHPNIVPYQVFETRDGHLIIAVGNDRQFASLCRIIGSPELGQDSRFSTNPARLENRDLLIDQLKPIIAGYAKIELLQMMKDNGVPAGLINTLPELFASDQVKVREMKVSVPHSQSASGTVDLIGNPVKFSKTPVQYRYGPPLCGEHSEEIMAELEAAQKHQATSNRK
jgi:crotonobetainyl-CoA:carnitine CoA-transferase CaiB-like acyl-CoA transferase